MFLFLIAAFLTLALAIVCLVGLAGGIVLCFSQRLRFAAPFVLFIPTLAAMGAGVGSWGLAYLADEHARHYAEHHSVSESMYVLPFWAWPFGFAAGAILGFSIGLALALVTRKRFRATSKGARQSAQTEDERSRQRGRDQADGREVHSHHLPPPRPR